MEMGHDDGVVAILIDATQSSPLYGYIKVEMVYDDGSSWTLVHVDTTQPELVPVVVKYLANHFNVPVKVRSGDTLLVPIVVSLLASYVDMPIEEEIVETYEEIKHREIKALKEDK